MMRMLAMAAAGSLLTACALNPLRSSHGLRVIAHSQYCGTPSQASQAHYFANANAFGDWVQYRSIDEFQRSLADGGAIVVEMGQRPTGGYDIHLKAGESRTKDHTLFLNMVWDAPRRDAAVSQALTAPCVAIVPPPGEYDEVRVVDQLGNIRGRTQVE